MQPELFPSDKSFDDSKPTFREKHGYELPKVGALVYLKYMEGVKWYIHYPQCPHGEDIIHGWMNKDEALNMIKKYKWSLKQ